ncbi:uncharacterized protein LOC128896516 [Hylaeus anthracinus]|uniref:uncharacterized protein LOC128896516 n=1 Tax=Hylaeus anthracinus TaxID=313031 RepID=UPI0023B93ACA|nr:uncharacterized protein LOC128896516 [Hylaeus anthracinus]
MLRSDLEKLVITDLRSLADSLNLGAKGSRSSVLDRVVSYYERKGELIDMSTDATAGVSESGGQSVSNANALFIPENAAGSTFQVRGGASDLITNDYNVNEIVRSVVRVLSERQRSTSTEPVLGNLSPNSAQNREVERNPTSTWHHVKYAGKLIPPFSGKEEECVLRWLERIACVACMYGFDDNTVLLAAISQLQGRARDWYNRQPLESIERKETYTTSMARINARIWKSQSEKFVEYAEDKLNLMQFLSFSEKEKIELLADGVKDFAIRRLVLDTWITNVPDFIEHVRRITEDSVKIRRTEPVNKFTNRSASISVPNRNGITSADKVCFTCRKPGHLAQNCIAARPTCFKCGQVGHLSSACPRREEAKRGDA